MVSADRRDSQEASLRPGSCLFLVGVKNDTCGERQGWPGNRSSCK